MTDTVKIDENKERGNRIQKCHTTNTGHNPPTSIHLLSPQPPVSFSVSQFDVFRKIFSPKFGIIIEQRMENLLLSNRTNGQELFQR